MANKIKIKVNGLTVGVNASLDTPLLYVLHNELHLHGPRFGCGLAQCGACSVLLDGKEIRSCVTPVAAVSGKSITTLEGLPAAYAAARGTTAAAPALHPLQQAWIDVQVPHCGYCQNGMMIQAADLLATTKNPSRGPDPHGDERAPLPLRDVSENPDRDPEGRGSDGEGRCMMTGFLSREGVLPQDLREGRRRARRDGRRGIRCRQGVGGERPHAVQRAWPAGLPAGPHPDRLVDHDHEGQQVHRHPRRDGARSRHADRHPHAHSRRAEHDDGPDDVRASRDVAERHGRRRRLGRHLATVDEHPRCCGACEADAA